MKYFILCLCFTTCSLFSLEQTEVLKIIQDKKLHIEMDLEDQEKYQSWGIYYLMGYWDSLDSIQNLIMDSEL